MKYRWVLLTSLVVIVTAFLLSHKEQGLFTHNPNDHVEKNDPFHFKTNFIQVDSQPTKIMLNPKKTLELRKNLNSSQDLFFQDNPKKMNIASNLRRPQNARSALLPQSETELQASELWENGDWQIWKGVRVLGSHDLSEEQQDPRQQMGSFGSQIFFQDSEYISNEHQFSSAHPMAVFNKKRNRIGLVFGIFTIHLHHQQDLENVLVENDLKLKAEIASINTYYVEVKNQPFDLVLKMAQLKSDPRIEQISLEVVRQVHASN